MGMTHLEKIVRLFEQERSATEPVAVIQYATTPLQKTVRGTVATIAALAQQQQVSSPAVIVIGAVVNESYLVDTLKVAASCQL
jgi:uroporphyrin-III C-methyltransferase